MQNPDFSNIPEYKPRPELPTDYVALAVVIRDGCVLVARRKKNIFLGGYWEFPGGKREAGESYAACALRELEEETTVIARTIRELYPIRYDYPKKRVVLQPYLCEYLSGEAEARGNAEVRWVPLGELGTLNMPEANKPIIKVLQSSELPGVLVSE